MLNFGLSLGKQGVGGFSKEEFLTNWDFSNGTTGWTPTDRVTDFTVTDGIASITRDGPFALVRQQVSLRPGTYIAEIEVNSTESGNSGYLYFQDTVGGDPQYPIDPADVGVHSTTLDITIGGTYWIGAGVNSPSPSTVTYKFVSLRPSNVILLNPDFTSGDGWQTNTDSHGYTGTATFDDSKVTLVAEEDNPSYFSLRPYNEVLAPGTYELKVVVTDISGRIKMSYKLAGTWTDVIKDITAPGEYVKEFTVNGGSTTDVQIGHQDASAGDSVTFDYIGIRKLS